MTIDAQAIIEEARSWEGTRFVHAQAVKGSGVDCVHLGIAIAKKFNLIPQDYKPPKYKRQWNLHSRESILLDTMPTLCNKIPEKEMEPGDFLCFRFGRCVSHMGIYIGDGKMVHAYTGEGVVEEAVFPYRGRLDSAWRLRQ